MRVIVNLTDEEINKAKGLAKKRNEKEKYFGRGRHGHLSDKAGSSEASHAAGLIAEIAVAKHFGVQIDERIFDKHGDDGYDMVIDALGGKVDVKSFIDHGNGMVMKDPHLKVPCEKKKDLEKMKNVDVYLGVCYEKKKPKEVHLFGWETKDNLLKKGRKKRYGQQYPLNYVLYENELNPIPIH